MGTIKMSKEDKAREEKWRVESAMDTIRRYGEIQKDKALMNKVKQMANEQVRMVNNVTGGAKKPTAKKK